MNWTFWTRTRPAGLDDCGTVDPLLSVYADGMADAEEARRVEAHLPDCAACRESLAWMRATQRAVSSRPAVAPPADLRARIADAIAASDAAPVPVFQVRPARVFALRPALTAAASVAFLGVLSYGLLHRDAPVTVPPMRVPQVAAAPPAGQIVPLVKSVAGAGVKRGAHHPIVLPKQVDPDLVAVNTPPKAVAHAAPVKTRPKIKDDAEKMADATPVKSPIKPAAVQIKKLTPRKSSASLVATDRPPTFSSETHRLPVVNPETRKPETIVATVPHTHAPTVSVPAFIEKPPVITPDPVPTVVVASNNSGGRFQSADLIRIPISQIPKFTHQIVNRMDKGLADRGAAYAMRKTGSENTGYSPQIYTP